MYLCPFKLKLNQTRIFSLGGWWRWALVSPDGVAPSRMVGVSASVNLPLHHKVQKFLLAPAHPGGPGKGAVKWFWCVVVWYSLFILT